MAYYPKNIEEKWQKKWDESQLFKTGTDKSKKKYYALDMFPYPSAAGLHIGHPLGYVATDIVSRYYRMNNYNVLHPMGWDAFGLPAEQHAIETGEHPAKVTYRCIENYKRQLSSLGFSFDWDREIHTCDSKYYKWTQWIFSKLYEKGLAYQAEVYVNWCPALKTVLANEEIVNGKSERGNHDVFRVPMKQWMLKITDYAEKLLDDLDTLDWPESTKEIQRNWIGKSEGVLLKFKIENLAEENIEVFTTRPDTIFGSTFLVLSPEHPLLKKIVQPEEFKSVENYREISSRKTDMDRTQLNKEKTGVFTGGYAINPISNEKIPIWIADYVLINYGAGAIMAVPAHDERDHEFAIKYGLEIQPVVQLEKENSEEFHDYKNAAMTSNGICINSEFLNGLKTATAIETISKYMEDNGIGKKTKSYKLRDWVFSRQRYWGEPIPVLKDSQGNIVRLLKEGELPLTLPEVVSYEPTGDGKSPLSAITNWVQRKNEKGELEFVETDTMPGSAGSSWYFIRYVDPWNNHALADYEEQKYWLPVDLYVGGQEHAVGHLMYARFWTKVLHDVGACPVKEPFQKLVHQGLLCRNGSKMSKSKGNGINPDEIVSQYGADSLRVYLMFMGPLTQTKEWEDNNLSGVHRFLSRIERHFLTDSGESLLDTSEPTLPNLKILHKTIKKVTEDIQNLSFNTAISQMMIFLNTVSENNCRSEKILAPFLKLLSPFAPHLSEELWEKCIVHNSHEQFVSNANWPTYSMEYVVDNEVVIGVQVNGKHRGEILIPRDADEKLAVEESNKVTSIVAAKEGKVVVKTIYVKGRILNFVVQ